VNDRRTADGDGPEIVVTGASGFLGRALVRRLRRSHRVRAFGSPRAPALIEGVEPLDVTTADWETLLPDRPAVVVHLAAMTNHRACDHDPAAATRVNVDAVRRLAMALALRRDQLVLASTGDVYGPDHEGPIAETAPLAPRGTYACTKAAAERVVAEHLPAHRALLVRPFHVYGPGMPASRLLPRFATMARAGKPATAAAGGRPVLTLTHVDDATDALAALVCSFGGGALNLAGREALPVAEVFATVARGVGSTLEAVLDPSRRTGDLVADTRALERRTGLALTRRLADSLDFLV
jgi:nucleoside-diphosphate-sugar epimerase